MARTMLDDEVAAVAATHEHARRSRTPVRRVTSTFPDMTLEDAYACQSAWVELQRRDGHERIGHKVGLTSRAMQLAMSIDEPDHGTLLSYMRIEEGATLAASDYLDPRLEVEVAFVLQDDLDRAEPTVDDVIAATSHVVGALELIDARSHRVDPDDGVPRTVLDTIADNAANAGIIVGATTLPPHEVDLRWVPAVLRRNDDVEETGVSAGVLGHPARGVAWLARRLAGYGTMLRAGEIVLAGSFTRPVVCRSGDVFEADFGPQLGTVTCRFA